MKGLFYLHIQHFSLQVSQKVIIQKDILVKLIKSYSIELYAVAFSIGELSKNKFLSVFKLY